MSDDTPPAQRRAVTSARDVFTLTGWRGAAVAAALGALVGFLIVRLSHGSSGPPAAPLRARWPLYASLGLWVVFNLYWTVAAKNAGPAQRAESSGSRGVHLLLLNGSLVLLFLPVFGLRGRFLPDRPAVAAIGLVVQTAFLFLAVWARRHLGRNWSGRVTLVADHQLVRSGPYRWIRHPVYTAMLGMYVGTAIVVGELHSVVATAILIAAYARKIGMEERVMRETFGAAHDDYRRETWVWIPPLW